MTRKRPTALRTTLDRPVAAEQLSDVCFVSLNGYAALSGRDDLTHIGGAERQLSLVAQGLAARGHRVAFVVWDHGQPDGIMHNGVRVFKTCPPDSGIPVLRFACPRATALWVAMRRANPQTIVQRMGEEVTGLVAMWCRYQRRPFVFCTASDGDCTGKLPNLTTLHERVLYRYGLRRADRVVVQTHRQRLLLEHTFGIDAELIRSCGAEPASGGRANRTATHGGSPRVLWVGRWAPVKRFEYLLELAELCPELRFDVVGPCGEETASVALLLRRAASLTHVVLHGRVPHARIGEYYRGAAVLVCTSVWEGFPNTFLEAWSYGVPTVSMVDPDGIIEAEGLGAIAHSVQGLARAVRDLIQSPSVWSATSRRARAYFAQNHTMEMAVRAYERLFWELRTGAPCRV